MRSDKVVFDQPFGKQAVEFLAVRREVAEVDEFLLQGLVKFLADRVVFGSMRPGKVLSDI